MESRDARMVLAFAISLLLHAAVLFIVHPRAGRVSGPASGAARSRLDVTLAGPARPAPPPPRGAATAATTATTSDKRRQAPKRRTGQRQLTSPAGERPILPHPDSGRSDMNRFLDGLAAPPKPPIGDELSQRSLDLARQLAGQPATDAGDEAAGQAAGEPLSLEMYFDAFVSKLNRSAAFVRNYPRTLGSRKALVQISLNSDGSLKSYRVLRAGDQEAEIAYIKRVVDQAAPFSAFPPDIRKRSDSLSIRICIFPAHAGEWGGFSRSFGDQDCKD